MPRLIFFKASVVPVELGSVYGLDHTSILDRCGLSCEVEERA